MFKNLDVSASALMAYRTRIDVIANNVANIRTTRDAQGRSIPYRRQFALFAAGAPGAADGTGVRVAGIEGDQSPFLKEWWPDHPDAVKSGQEKGYVYFPNVRYEVEMVDMVAATRAYQANVTAYEAGKSIIAGALRLVI